jgi:Flp pilus assembly protein TadG
MGRHPIRNTERFDRDEQGGVAILFALVLVVITFAAGVGLDFARVLHARTGLASAADAAALAAGRALSDGTHSDAEIRTVAQAFFTQNLHGADTFGDVGGLSVAIDRDAGRVKVDVAASVPMTLTRVAGFKSMTVPVTSETATSSRDIELALVLDVTGSMSGSKIADLRTAAIDLVDQVIPDGGRSGRARVGLAPYATSVNAGSFFQAATGRRTGTGCVIERAGAARFDEDAPAAGAYFSYDRSVPCPSASVQPLTEDKRAIERQIRSLGANGSTAGHIGAAWGWYLVSPKWSGIWPADSRPAAYDASKTIKAVLLMTDGAFNDEHVEENGKSASQARALCRNMKEAGVTVYSVAFVAGAEAEALLRECASSPAHYFTADDGDALKGAFRAVGNSLTDLYLTQ